MKPTDAHQPATNTRLLWPWFGGAALLSGLGTAAWLVPLPVTLVLVVVLIGVIIYEVTRAKKTD